MMVSKRFALFAILWLVLTSGDPSAWWVGGVAAAVATWASIRLLPPAGRRLRVLSAVALLPGFARSSLQGGLDVAWRAVHPRLPLSPDWVRYPVRLPPGPLRAVLGSELSLMPGTLAAGEDGRNLLVHCLDRKLPVSAVLSAEEERIAAAAGIKLDKEND